MTRYLARNGSSGLGLLLVLVLVLSSSGCEQGDNERPAPTGDGDADADADTDADADADADADPTLCTVDEDCVLALDFRNDTCCPCPEAVRTDFVAATECVEPYPHEGPPPQACAEPCECDACREPEGARCDRSHCVVRFPGACVTREDCDPTEMCVVFQGESRCQADPTVCEEDDECEESQWCAPSDRGVRRCRELEPGECRRDEQCAKDEGCEGSERDQPGHCE